LRYMHTAILLLSLIATSCALSEKPTMTENTPPDHPFRVSLSVSPFTNAMIASGVTFTDGKHHARTDEKLQRLFAAHGANEVYARIATSRKSIPGAGGDHSLEHGLARARMAKKLGLPFNPELGLWETLILKGQADLLRDLTSWGVATGCLSVIRPWGPALTSWGWEPMSLLHSKEKTAIARPSIQAMVEVLESPNPNALKTKILTFEKMKLSDDMFEAAAVFDVNKDGHLDIVCGSFWYEGPDFGTSHKICVISTQREGAEKLEGRYDLETITGYDDFANIPMDVNGDGYMDIVSGGWFGRTLLWRENPKGKPEEWGVHVIEEIGEIETIRIWDVDNDGDPEILPNTPLGPQQIFKLVRDDAGKGTGKFQKLTISDQPSGHGLGFGDINMDGRSDIVHQTGWLEAPENPLEEEWKRHSDLNLVGLVSAPILVLDINGDSLNDLIVGQAHDYGLAWHEQKRKADGTREWTKHDIDTTRSQYHTMALVDIDNDGAPELITGKRCLAHWGKDPGAFDPAGLYYFKINGGDFQLHIIDEGPIEEASGVGIYLWVADLDGNGWKDIVAPGKEGLYLFKNMGRPDVFR